jgi:hypothetical protein
VRGLFRLSLYEHDGLCEDLRRFASALLPHENADLTQFSAILSSVTRLVHVDEMELEYYLFFSIAEKLERVFFQTGGNPVFSRSVFEGILMSNMYDAVKKDRIGIVSMLERSGMPSNLSVEQSAQDAMNKLMGMAMDLFDECFSMAISPMEALGYLVSFRTNYVSSVGVEAIRAQAFILNSSNELNSPMFDGWREFLKRKSFMGPEGWREFCTYVSSELELRLRESREDRSPLKTLEQAEKLRQEAIYLSEQISSYGIPPIDSVKAIVRSGYSILIGRRGMGKTTLSLNFAVNVFIDGYKILIISEENRESSILYEYLLPIYIYKKFGFFASYKQILGVEEVGGVSQREVEERKKMIKMAVIDFTESGRYMYVKSINAWHAYDELAKIYSEFQFDYAVVDHTLSMHGGGETTPRLEAFSKGVKEFKNEFGKHVLVLSHTSPRAEKIKDVSDAQGLTRYSTQLEGDADDIYYIFDNDQIESRGLLAFVQTKGRGSKAETSLMYLTKIFEYKLFRYDPQMQDGFVDNADILGEVTVGFKEEGWDDSEDFEDLI